MDERAGKWPATALCRVLELSESGYYRYLKRKGRPDRDELLSGEIQKILDESPYNDNYGVRRMQLALAQRGVLCGLRRLTRLMCENGWLHERRRRPKSLTKPDLRAMAAENLLHQDFSADIPWRKLLTDITQIQCADGKLCISPIMDCFNGEILSLFMDNNIHKELCIDTLKKELLYRIPAYHMTMDKVKTLVFRYVFIYYNQYRVYTSNRGGLPPAAFRISVFGCAA